MSAQAVRLNTTASNLANAESISGNEKDVYRSKHPLFSSILQDFDNENSEGVKVLGIVESNAPSRKEYLPNHPLANDQGYVFMPNVNAVEEMANMISASRSYQTNVEVLNTSKQMLLKTLGLGD